MRSEDQKDSLRLLLQQVHHQQDGFLSPSALAAETGSVSTGSTSGDSVNSGSGVGLVANGASTSSGQGTDSDSIVSGGNRSETSEGSSSAGVNGPHVRMNGRK